MAKKSGYGVSAGESGIGGLVEMEASFYLAGRRKKAHLSTLVGCVFIVGACGPAGQGGDELSGADSDPIGKVQERILCGPESRTQVTSFSYPRGAVGWLQDQTTGGGCAATIIAPFKIMTAQHCLGPLTPSQLMFFPHMNILGPGVHDGQAGVVRWVMGRDETETALYND